MVLGVVTREEILAARDQEWSLNNVALKSIRDNNENPPGLVTRGDGVGLFAFHEFSVLSLVRPKDSDPSW
mgnify:CR=1 FL=1